MFTWLQNGTLFLSAATLALLLPLRLNAQTDGTRSQTSTSVVPTLRLLRLAAPTVLGGKSTVGIVILSGRAPASGFFIALNTDTPRLITVPASVLVPAGRSSAAFQIGTQSVLTPTDALIRTAGTGAKSATLQIRPPSLSQLLFSSETLTSGDSLTAVLLLDAPAATNITIHLSCSGPLVHLDESTLTIPKGEQRATFTVTAAGVSARKEAKISASADGLTRTATIAIVPVSSH